MRFADAHCDTLVKWNNEPFYTKEAAWNLKKFKKVGGRLQYMAICSLPEHVGDSAMKFAVNHIGIFHAKKPKQVVHLENSADYDKKKVNVVIALENAAPIINDINNLYAFHKLGVRLITLTWNHRNSLADGVNEPYGLTEFGKRVVTQMQELGIIVDVSHLNENGFKDVAKIANLPFMASHSNAWEICNHPRNLKDYQIKKLVQVKGFVGLNLYTHFLSERKSSAKSKFYKHVSHFLNLGAEDILGIGADYDGIDETPFPDVTYVKEIADGLSEKLGLGDELIAKILCDNLESFTLKMLKDS